MTSQLKISIVSLAKFLGIITFILLCCNISGQTNKGKDFWTCSPMQSNFSSANAMTLKLYVGTDNIGDSVSIAFAEGSSNQWVKTFWVPANAIVAIDSIPDSTTVSRIGLNSNKAIHISSKNSPIYAYSHAYASTNSGASFLLPSNGLGYEYFVLTAKQNYSSSGGYSTFKIIAIEDSTWVEFNPTNPALGGILPNGGGQANGSYLIKINKGDVFNILGAAISGTEGYDLSGSSIRSISNAQGKQHPIGVFAGNSRTGISCIGSPTGSGDIIFQHLLSFEQWDTSFLFAPAVKSGGTIDTNFMTNIFRIMVKDPNTLVKLNGTLIPAGSILKNSFYQFETNKAGYIQSNKPIQVAQYLPSFGGCSNSTGDGDPEMILLSPLRKGITKTFFFRTSEYAISSNFLILTIPTSGIDSLKIDGILVNNISPVNKVLYPHPNLSGYSVVIRKWSASKAAVLVEANQPFTGITYGLGAAESYGYNIGSSIDTNAIALPLRLINFKAIKNGNNNLLHWITDQEINSKYFEVERSTNSSGFKSLGIVNAGKMEYRFVDNSPFKAINYYRLKIVDKDGKFEYSPVRKVNNTIIILLSVYPNPTQDKLRIQMESQQQVEGQLKIVDMLGKLVMTRRITLQEGTSFSTIDIGTIPKGKYFLKVICSKSTQFTLAFEKL